MRTCMPDAHLTTIRLEMNRAARPVPCVEQLDLMTKEPNWSSGAALSVIGCSNATASVSKRQSEPLASPTNSLALRRWPEAIGA
jgi:hypothetical protein